MAAQILNHFVDLMRKLGAVLLIMLAQISFGSVAFAQTPGYEKITWDDLLNEEWYAQMRKDVAAYDRMAFLKDGSEEAEKLMKSLRQKLDEAPVSRKYIGRKIRMPGFVVPLDAVRDSRREFLLVPYFGACIHAHHLPLQTKLCWSVHIPNSSYRNPLNPWTWCGLRVN